MDQQKALFPVSLARAAQQGFGACTWSSPDCARSVWLARTHEGGFEALLHGAKGLILGVSWHQEGPEAHPQFVCDKAWGPGSDALSASGLDPDGRHGRVMDVLGSVVLALPLSASTPRTPAQPSSKLNHGTEALSVLDKPPRSALHG